MKLNLKQPIKNLMGVQLTTENEPTTIGLLLANIILVPHKNKDGFRPLKAYELAKKFYEEDEIELDNSDVVQIKDILEKNEGGYQPLVVAQLQLAIIEAEKNALPNIQK